MPNEPALSWTDALRSRRFQLLTLSTSAGLIAALLALNRYLVFNEHRIGVELRDPVLARLPVMDMSGPIFALLNGTLILTLAYLAKQPRPLLIALQAYALMAVVRIVMMFSIPLEAPPGMIMLADPLVRLFGDGGGNWAKDLFFSGHTSTTFLCALSVRSRSRPLELLCFATCASVAVLVLLQHVHYTVDVLVAPFVAFACHRAARSTTAHALDG
jgi:hypothetical protein